MLKGEGNWLKFSEENSWVDAAQGSEGRRSMTSSGGLLLTKIKSEDGGLYRTWHAREECWMFYTLRVGKYCKILHMRKTLSCNLYTHEGAANNLLTEVTLNALEVVTHHILFTDSQSCPAGVLWAKTAFYIQLWSIKCSCFVSIVTSLHGARICVPCVHNTIGK